MSKKDDNKSTKPKETPLAQIGAEPLAKEVNVLYRKMAMDTMVAAWEIGRKLVNLKNMVRADGFEKFCAAHLDFSYGHALKLIRVGTLPSAPAPAKKLAGPVTVLNIDELAKLATNVENGADYTETLANLLEGKEAIRTAAKTQPGKIEAAPKDTSPAPSAPFAGSKEHRPAQPTKEEITKEALGIIGITTPSPLPIHIEEETLDIIFDGLNKLAKGKKNRLDDLKYAESVLMPKKKGK